MKFIDHSYADHTSFWRNLGIPFVSFDDRTDFNLLEGLLSGPFVIDRWPEQAARDDIEEVLPTDLEGDELSQDGRKRLPHLAKVVEAKFESLRSQQSASFDQSLRDKTANQGLEGSDALAASLRSLDDHAGASKVDDAPSDRYQELTPPDPTFGPIKALLGLVLAVAVPFVTNCEQPSSAESHSVCAEGNLSTARCDTVEDAITRSQCEQENEAYLIPLSACH